MSEQQDPAESSIFGVSLRGLIVVMVVATICLHTLWCAGIAFWSGDLDLLTVDEPFYSLVMITVGYYFGQKTTNK